MSTEKDKENIGIRLKEMRTSLKLKQKDIAEACSTSTGYLSDIEKGKTNISIPLLISLKRVYNIDIDYLLTGENSLLRDSEITTTENVKNIQYGVIVDTITDERTSGLENQLKETKESYEKKIYELELELKIKNEMLDKLIGVKTNSLAEVGAAVGGNNPNYLDFNIGSQLRAIAAEPKASYSADNGTKNK